MSTQDRLEKYSIPVTECGCQIWMGAINNWGYGRISVGGKKESVHRLAWSERNGPIPEGKLVLHTCDTPPCINPDHLFIGSPKDNSDDRSKKGRTSHVGGPCGVLSGRAKLTTEEVIAIRSDQRASRLVAKTFNVSSGYVRQIKQRRYRCGDSA